MSEPGLARFFCIAITCRLPPSLKKFLPYTSAESENHFFNGFCSQMTLQACETIQQGDNSLFLTSRVTKQDDEKVNG